MSLVRIDLSEGKSADYRRAVADSVHQVLVEATRVPRPDRFQIITEHAPKGLIYDPSYLDIQRTDDVIFIQITFNAGRTVEQKQALYARMTELLVENAGVRAQDVFINLIEVPRENWSFGNGFAQFA